MTRKELVNKVTRSFHGAGAVLKKYSPEILLVAGVTGTVVSAVMACKATTKLDVILEESKNKIDTIHKCVEKPEEVLPEGTTYSVEESKKDLTIVYTQSALELVKLYAPSVAVGALSITAILAGHNIMRKRNLALAAAYTAVDTSFKEYRGRVIERFGEALDKELRFNVKTKEVEEVVVNEDGTESVVTKTVEVANPNDAFGAYIRCFDESCKGWTKSPSYTRMFLEQQQRVANDMLQAKGHLTLNQVFDLLGIPHSEEGFVVGWIYDKECPNGDNYIDFGIYDMDKEANRDFINGHKNCLWLDFNVDGVIANKI